MRSTLICFTGGFVCDSQMQQIASSIIERLYKNLRYYNIQESYADWNSGFSRKKLLCGLLQQVFLLEYLFQNFTWNLL